jgi:hypothetical protein
MTQLVIIHHEPNNQIQRIISFQNITFNLAVELNLEL